MKSSLRYFKLWQQKRNELRIDNDPQNDWLEMQRLLDTHMPVTNSVGSGTVSAVSKYKLLSTFFVTISAAAMIYFIAHTNKTTNHKQQTKHSVNFNHHSVSNSSVTDSSNTNISKSDSIPAIKRSLALQDIKENKTDDGKESSAEASSNLASNNTIAASAKTGNALTTKGGNKDLHNSETANASVTGRTATINNNTVKANHSAINNIKTNANRNPSSRNLRTNKYAATSAKNNNSWLARNHNRHRYNNKLHNALIVNHKANLSGRATLSGNGRLLHSVVRNRNSHLLQSRHRANINNHETVNGQQNQQALINDTHSEPVAPTQLMSAVVKFSPDTTASLAISTFIINKAKAELQIAAPNQSKNTKGDKKSNVKNPTNSKLDWGILVGVNSSGSFTPKSQNSNFYGSLPVDVYFGLFATYNLNNKWALNTQIRLLNPQTISGSYTHPNESKKDTDQTLIISDSRKVYTVDVPFHIVYNATSNVSFKVGPMVSLQVKQANGSSTFQTGKLKKDTAYYTTVTSAINNTSYDRKLNFGLSGGVAFRFQRFDFEATYFKGFQGQQVSSSLGSYTANSNMLQFTLGFKLNRMKH